MVSGYLRAAVATAPFGSDRISSEITFVSRTITRRNPLPGSARAAELTDQHRSALQNADGPPALSRQAEAIQGTVRIAEYRALSPHRTTVDRGADSQPVFDGIINVADCDDDHATPQ